MKEGTRNCCGSIVLEKGKVRHRGSRTARKFKNRTLKAEGCGTQHANPVTRKLVIHPKDWAWSSWSHYERGDEGLLRIDPFWRKERYGNRARQPQESSRTAPLKPKGAAPRSVSVLTSAPPARVNCLRHAQGALIGEGNRAWLRRVAGDAGPDYVADFGEVIAAGEFDALVGGDDAQQRDGAA
jgi:hypothetical protein